MRGCGDRVRATGGNRAGCGLELEKIKVKEIIIIILIIIKRKMPIIFNSIEQFSYLSKSRNSSNSSPHTIYMIYIL